MIHQTSGYSVIMIPAGFTIYEHRFTATNAVYTLKRKGAPPQRWMKSVFHFLSLLVS